MRAAPAIATFAPLQQSPQYARMLAQIGRDTETVATDAGSVQVLQRPTPLGALRYAARGPLWSVAEPGARRGFLRQARIHLLAETATPAALLRRAGYIPLMTPASRALLPLDGTPLATAHPKWRASLRQGHGTSPDLELRRFDPVTDTAILGADRAQQRARGYRGYPAAFTLAYAAANPADVLTLTACKGDTITATMIILRHGGSASYHIGHTTAAGRAQRAHYLMLDLAARHLAQAGCDWLDLGPVDTIHAPGLARFKLGTGAHLHRSTGTWLRRPFARGS